MKRGEFSKKDEAKEHYQEIRNIAMLGWVVTTIFIMASFLCLFEFSKNTDNYLLIFAQTTIFLMWLFLDGRHTYYNEMRKRELDSLFDRNDGRVHGIFLKEQIRYEYEALSLKKLLEQKPLPYERILMFQIGKWFSQSKVILWYFIIIILGMSLVIKVREADYLLITLILMIQIFILSIIILLIFESILINNNDNVKLQSDIQNKLIYKKR